MPDASRKKISSSRKALPLSDPGLIVRAIAVQTLWAFERNREIRLKADQALEQEIAKSGTNNLPATDRRLLQALVMGCLRWQARLDGWIEQLSGRPLNRIEPVVRCLLRLGLYQLHGLDQVPAYAALDTTVVLTRQQTRSERTVKFVNALLREAQRRLEKSTLPHGEGTEAGNASITFAQNLLWKSGWPIAWTDTLLKSYTQEQVAEMAKITQNPPNLGIRINTLKNGISDYLAQLSQRDIVTQRPDIENLPEALVLPGYKEGVRQLPGYEQGAFYVQDASSMWVAHLVDPQPGEQILDLCAAPGSKTSLLCALSQNQALITAVDPVPERLVRLQENLSRLGAENVTVFPADGLKLGDNPDWPSIQFDKVLVDAPCSGSGTIRRHPEIIRHLAPPRLKPFIQKQLALLSEGFRQLRPGGILIYSTCSILPVENETLIRKFIATEKGCKLLSQEQRLISEQSDGFFAARLLKL